MVVNYTVLLNWARDRYIPTGAETVPGDMGEGTTLGEYSYPRFESPSARYMVSTVVYILRI